MKKILALVLCLLSVASLFAGCKKNEEQTGRDNVITIGVLEHANCSDYENNAFTKWLEAEAGVDLEFVIFPGTGTDAASKLGTWIAVGEELPDILWNVPLDTSVYTEYGEDEYFIDLKPYFEDKEKSATFWERMEEVKATSPQSYETTMRKLVDQDTGAMYAFPMVQTTMIDSMDYQVFINQEWLDNLNLEMPTDAESLYNVLVAFRDQDANGNGDTTDEIPMLGASGSLSGDMMGWLLNMFLYVDDAHYWNVDENGQLYMPYTTDEFREAMVYINRLFEEGLMSESYFAMSYKDVKSLVNTADGTTGRVGVWSGHPTLVCEINNNILEQYTAMPIWGNAIVNEIQPSMKTFITYDCDNVDKAWEILMLMCSKEGGYRMYYGEKGVDWDDADEGTKSYMDLDAEIKVINNITQAIGNEMWKTLSACILVYAEHELTQLPAESDPWLTAKQDLIKDCYDKYQAAAVHNPTVVCPTLVYTTAESDAISDQRTNCKSYITQMTSMFAVGSKDISDDAVWTAYLKELENMGISQWQEMAQKVYDRQTAG